MILVTGIIAGTAFLVGLIAGMVVNYMALRRWRKTLPKQEGWYHTWHRH